MEVLDYKKAAIKALHDKDLSMLKELHLLKSKGLQICYIDEVKDLAEIIPNDVIGFILSPAIKNHLDSLFIKSVLDGSEYKHDHIHTPSLSREEVRAISEKLEFEF